MSDHGKLAGALRQIYGIATDPPTATGKFSQVANLAADALAELGEPDPRQPLLFEPSEHGRYPSPRGKCPYCGRRKVQIRANGRLRAHNDRSTGARCGGTGQVPS